MKFKNWSIDSLIEYLQEAKRSGVDWHYQGTVSGEISIENGKPLPKYQKKYGNMNYIDDGTIPDFACQVDD